MVHKIKQQNVVSLPTSVCSRKAAVSRIIELAQRRSSEFVCLSNVHMCFEAWRNPKTRAAIAKATLVLADGKPIYWAQKLLGHGNAQQYRGRDLTWDVCKEAERLGLVIGFYGSEPHTVSPLVLKLLNDFPSLKVYYSKCPPFTPASSTELQPTFQDMTDTEVSILFVGLGCPKQELWMAEHYKNIPAVSIGVGAAFDFISGNKKEAPLWMSRRGLEWLYRLAKEPRRLWKRYCITNTAFIVLFGTQWMRYLVTKIRLN